MIFHGNDSGSALPPGAITLVSLDPGFAFRVIEQKRLQTNVCNVFADTDSTTISERYMPNETNSPSQSSGNPRPSPSPPLDLASLHAHTCGKPWADKERNIYYHHLVFSIKQTRLNKNKQKADTRKIKPNQIKSSRKIRTDCVPCTVNIDARVLRCNTKKKNRALQR